MPPENRQRSGLFLSLAFYNAPSSHIVDFDLSGFGECCEVSRIIIQGRNSPQEHSLC